MSGSLPQGAPTASSTVSAGQAGVMNVAYGCYPSEGSRCVTAQYSWGGGILFYVEDLSQLVAKGVETSIQTVFIDNSTNPDPIVMTINGTGQVVECPAAAQGVFPVFFTGTPGFVIQSGTSQPETAGAVTRCYFLNTPGQAAVWAAPVPGSLASIAPTIDGGQSSFLGAAASGSLKVGRGRVATVTVNVAVAVGTITINDAPASGTVTAANTIETLNAVNGVQGAIFTLNFPFVTGLALNFNGGATGTLSISWT